MTGLKLKNIRTDKNEIINVDGAFVAIGHSPNTNIFRHQIELDTKGYIKTFADSCATSVKGVFAAGDVKDPFFRQAIIAAGSGAQAAIEAGKFLNS